jgi:hypothetical protein
VKPAGILAGGAKRPPSGNGLVVLHDHDEARRGRSPPCRLLHQVGLRTLLHIPCERAAGIIAFKEAALIITAWARTPECAVQPLHLDAERSDAWPLIHHLSRSAYSSKLKVAALQGFLRCSSSSFESS